MSVAAQVSFLTGLENYALSQEGLSKSMHVIIQSMYKLDIVEEEAILRWHETSCKDETMRAAVVPLIEWLQEASEEDSDDSE